MNDSIWNYTAAEKRAIGAAFDEVAYLMEATGHREERRLRESLKVERRDRSCGTTAKALICNAFADGMRHDPPASALACYSDGLADAVILGAGYARQPSKADRGRLPALLDAAKAAHDSRMQRGIERARAG